jgi:hypothetical protein
MGEKQHKNKKLQNHKKLAKVPVSVILSEIQ